LFVGRDDLPDLVHGVDDLSIRGHGMTFRERVFVIGEQGSVI
jgi:hypothetical protein